jgi:hypothetical protein
MQRPCKSLKNSKAAKLGAKPRATVGGTNSTLERTRHRLRPILSESGPQIQAPTAMATTTTEIVSPARAAPIPNSRPRVGRIACVQ